MRKLLSAFIIAVVIGLTSVSAAFAQHEEESFDPVHHTADGY